mgnify:CR=1 FL=1|jgi:MoaA/NifB/PqqE/SkfB family radical SAM enzyme
MNIASDLIYTLNFDITTYCNLHCPQCKRYDFNGDLIKTIEMTHMDLETIKHNINFDSLPNLRDIRNVPTYGDAMLHPDIKDWIEFFKNYRYLISTNGSMRTPKWWEELGGFENLTVMFAIDGLEDTNEIYRINSNYNKIMENAKAFINAGGNATWQFIVFKHNEHQVEQARKLSVDLGFGEFTTVYTDRSWFQGNTWPVRVKGEYLYDIEQASKSDNHCRYDNEYNISKTDVDITMATPHANKYENCFAFIREEWFVNHQGYLLPCCQTAPYMDNNADIPSQMWLNILKDPESININKHTIDEIFNSEFYTHQLMDSWQNDSEWTHPSCNACFTFK